jgi:hypothetical protein
VERPADEGSRPSELGATYNINSDRRGPCVRVVLL